MTLADLDTMLRPASPPTGTVTFLFTDLEGSTLLWEVHPQAMPAALARHDLIVNDSSKAHPTAHAKHEDSPIRMRTPEGADA